MALGHVGRPALPLFEQLRQLLDGRDAGAQAVVGTGQQLGTPGGHAGSGVQHRHQRFAPVEGGVERGEVADLQGHRAQADQGGQVGQSPRGAAVGRQVSQGAQRGAGQLEGPGQPGRAHGRPHQQGEADLEDGQPHHDLQDERNWGLGRQHPIARFIGVEVVGDKMEATSTETATAGRAGCGSDAG